MIPENEQTQVNLVEDDVCEKKCNKRSRIPSQEESDDEKRATCSICFDLISQQGSHQAACLKCGHIFGESCIKRWLEEGSKKCPQCNKRARELDLRLLYNLPCVAAVAASDEKVKQDLEKRLNEEKREREKVQQKLLVVEAQLKAAMKQQKNAARSQYTNVPISHPSPSSGASERRHPALSAAANPLESRSVVVGDLTGHGPRGSADLEGHARRLPLNWLPNPESQRAPNNLAWLLPDPAQQLAVGGTSHPVTIEQNRHEVIVLDSQDASSRLHGHQQTHGVVAMPGPQSSQPREPAYNKLQDLTLNGAHCCDMDANNGLLLIPEELPDGKLLLRKHSMYSPSSRQRLPLPPSYAKIWDIKCNPASNMVALATQGAGLAIHSTTSDNPVTVFRDFKDCRSCCWRKSGTMQLWAAGKSCVSLFDLRCCLGPVETIPYNRMMPPFHTLIDWDIDNIAMHSGQGPSGDPRIAFSGSQSGCLGVLAASPLGVFQAQVGGTITQLLEPQPGCTCESLALDSWQSSLPGGTSSQGANGERGGARSSTVPLRLAVSWRCRQGRPYHQMLSLKGDQCQDFGSLDGHTSRMVMTRGTFLPPSTRGLSSSLFCSADEETCTPWIWSMGTRNIVQKLGQHPDALTQLVAASTNNFGNLLACCSPSLLTLYIAS